MNLSEIKRLYWNHLESGEDSIVLDMKALLFLIVEAEALEKIKAEADELYSDEINLPDFGERVLNIIQYVLETNYVGR